MPRNAGRQCVRFCVRADAQIATVAVIAAHVSGVAAVVCETVLGEGHDLHGGGEGVLTQSFVY
jgi:hypothetical protein